MCRPVTFNVTAPLRKLKELQEKGHPVDVEVLKVLSPYRREHINRLGNYLPDLQRRAPRRSIQRSIFLSNQPLSGDVADI
ncbi:hypothetical protein CS8_036720 [Cupriavidus sp. 8B]